MNNQIIKDAISAAIAPNGVKAISGQVLQDALLDMIDALGAGATFLGEATPDTDPGTPDGNFFYFATMVGAYAFFDIVVDDGEIAFIYGSGNVWSKLSIHVASATTPSTITENTTKFPANTTKTLKAWILDAVSKINGLISAQSNMVTLTGEQTINSKKTFKGTQDISEGTLRILPTSTGGVVQGVTAADTGGEFNGVTRATIGFYASNGVISHMVIGAGFSNPHNHQNGGIFLSPTSFRYKDNEVWTAGNLPQATVDKIAQAVLLSGAQTINDVKSFSAIPVLPATNPTTANQAVRKGYVDGLIGDINTVLDTINGEVI